MYQAKLHLTSQGTLLLVSNQTSIDIRSTSKSVSLYLSSIATPHSLQAKTTNYFPSTSLASPHLALCLSLSLTYNGWMNEWMNQSINLLNHHHPQPKPSLPIYQSIGSGGGGQSGEWKLRLPYLPRFEITWGKTWGNITYIYPKYFFGGREKGKEKGKEKEKESERAGWYVMWCDVFVYVCNVYM